LHRRLLKNQPLGKTELETDLTAEGEDDEGLVFGLQSTPIVESIDEAKMQFTDQFKGAQFRVPLSVDPSSICISVNELPAYHAEKVCVVMKHKDAFPDGVPALLVGDEGLGLSYFKGLNAGLEASATLMTHLAPTLKAGKLDLTSLQSPLMEYSNWFVKDYAPHKVKEVAEYSKWRIRAVATAVKVFQQALVGSWYTDVEIEEPNLRHYFNLMVKGKSEDDAVQPYHQFPHRPYDPVKFFQTDFVPAAFNFKKMGKLFADYVKPYKSAAQAGQDFKQPLTALGNLLLGTYKLFAGFKHGASLSGDGVVTIMRGLLELVTTPLNLVLKPIVRGLVTAFRGTPIIEESFGIFKLAEIGRVQLQKDTMLEQSGVKPSAKNIYELLEICEDIHRKFNKAHWRGQRSDVLMEEERLINAIRAKDNHGKYDSPAEFSAYFSLFNPYKKKLEKVEEKAAQNLALVARKS
jgi:hypothetical protein